MLQIKDPSLVITETKKKWGTELVIKRDNPSSHQGETKLSDVLVFTPPGYILKDSTGMGATTLELRAPRHSIIVEPIRITASSKAYDETIKSGSKVLYVGSATKYHPGKMITDEEIEDYINDPTIQYKKIIVVADSLLKVYAILGNSPLQFKIFLLIDEIDSLQMDSTYRKSMETCIEVYKGFPDENRAMLSATRIDFTDPILKSEPITWIKYDYVKPRIIDVFCNFGHNVIGATVDCLRRLIKNYPLDKIFIAYNSVDGCYDISEYLVTNNIVGKADISILCSTNSQSRVKEYYKELNSDVLPSKINFFTSAYFSGFDINEEYHLVSVSGIRSQVHTLSERNLKQIAGRSRKKILSESVIHNSFYKKPGSKEFVFPTDEELRNKLKENANTELDSIECMKKHFSKNIYLKESFQDFSRIFLSSLEEKSLSCIRTDIFSEFQISYLNIDAEVESNRVKRDLYQDLSELSNKLISEGHDVTTIPTYSKTDVLKNKESQKDRDAEIQEILDLLEHCDSESDVDDVINKNKQSDFQINIADKYKSIIEYVDNKEMLIQTKKALIGKRDLRIFNNLIESAYFLTLDKDHLYVTRLNHYFPIGGKYTKEEFNKRLDLYLAELPLKNKSITKDQKTKLIKNIRNIGRSRNKKTNVDYETIKGSNPKKVIIKKHRIGVLEDWILTNMFNS